MSDGYTILDLGALEAHPYHQRDGQRLLPVQRTLGYVVAGVNGWTGDPGEPLVPEHEEDTDEELYAVVRGRATFTVDGQAVDAPAGTLIHLTAGEKRSAVAEEPGTIVLVVGATPGVVNEPTSWTSFVVADSLRRRGRIEEGRVAIREAIAFHPGAWHAPYNAACYEALAGDADAAFELLDQALALDADGVRGHAPGDPDLESLHDDPRWQEVIA